MKTEISIKKIRENVRHTYCAGYCSLQTLLSSISPLYYNSGIYGWNCDIYYFPKYDIAITTGYRNMCGKTIPNNLIEKYEKEAEFIKAYSEEENVEILIDSLVQLFLKELLAI